MIPKHVIVGGRTYEVRSDQDGSGQLRDRDNKGETYIDRLIIRVDGDLPPALIRETLLHEVMHAAWNMVGLHRAGLTNEQEEQVITALSPALTEVWRNNPELRDYVLAVDR